MWTEKNGVESIRFAGGVAYVYRAADQIILKIRGFDEDAPASIDRYPVKDFSVEEVKKFAISILKQALQKEIRLLEQD